jgi:hypothetical protein
MTPTPYSNAEPWRLWRRAVAGPAQGDVDPGVVGAFTLAREDRVVTAGSCFAQHIGRHLRLRGFRHFITERAHPVLDEATAAEFQYDVYSARYGNLYTARQLLQLFQRAFGQFAPVEDRWEENGSFFDPFRPLIQPGGFASRAEFQRDRDQHFHAVRRAFAELDVLVFTLGLTECWESTADGAVFPLCPGTAHGAFDAARHRLRNLSVQEVTDDLRAFVRLLRGVNPAARVILTVSPVPLVATAEQQHVLSATIYSKSVLRVAAETVSRAGDAVYFPSYEIITGPHARRSYFAEDCRTITEAGVAHVMRSFFRQDADGDGAMPVHADETAGDPAVGQSIVAVLCEEEGLAGDDQPNRSGAGAPP